MNIVKPLIPEVAEAQCRADADLEIEAEAVRGDGSRTTTWVCLGHAIERVRKLVAGDRGASDFSVRMVEGPKRVCGEHATGGPTDVRAESLGHAAPTVE